jgi:hypothetical protein
MTKLLHQRWLLCLFSFLAGIVAASAAPWLVSSIDDRLLPENRKEIARVTSPDGAVDAVMIRTNCGAPCSFGYEVYILGKGKRPPSDPQRALFSADDVLAGEISWTQPHLLSIGYTRAKIYSFRNISYPFGEFGAKEKNWKYEVELRLAPSSSGSLSLSE